EICQGDVYSLNGFNVSTSGLHTQNLQTIKGCDSIIVLNLVVNPTPIIPEDLDAQIISNYIELTWQDNGSSYIIYRNDDSLTTTTNPTYLDYDLIHEQSYCYKVKSMNGDCESEFSNIVCKTYLSLENINQTNISTKLYPNPTNVKASLEVEGLNAEAYVLIYDMVGRVIQRHKINKGKNELEIDLTGYAKGVYSIRIMNDNINQTKKLIVN
ncbi:MAG: T9SS type A sorting domain-containing protein, partial [Bacteroidales bacterium]